MTHQATIDQGKTAVLIMDFNRFIVEQYASDPQGVVQKAARVLQGARQAGIPVVYVVPGGREGIPEPEFHAEITPAQGEKMVTKSRIGSFSTTGLDALLRQMGRDTLVLMGVATSGCVLSTLRWAADLNYKLVVVADACSDPDPEVHRVLTENAHPNSFLTFSRLGSVLSTQEFLQAAGVA